MPIHNTCEGGTSWLGNYGGNPCPVFDYPFFSNHCQVSDAYFNTKYVHAGWEEIGGDAKSPHLTRPTVCTEGRVRVIYFVPKRRSFAVALIEKNIRLKREIEPDLSSPIFPIIAQATGMNNLLILPGKEPNKFATIIDPKTKRRAKGNPANRLVKLPYGTYAGGIITLTPDLVLSDRLVGFPAPPPDTLTLPAGMEWDVSYLRLMSRPFHWRYMNVGDNVDNYAERALIEMSFRGETPYKFNLTKGKIERIAYIADITAEDYGVVGRLKGADVLFDLPMRLRGLNPRWASAVWRSDSRYLDYFAFFNGVGYLTFELDRDVEFYIGNVVLAGDPALITSVVLWNSKEAWIRINNPTRETSASG